MLASDVSSSGDGKNVGLSNSPTQAIAQELGKKCIRIPMTSAIGFNGKITQGLILHPGQKHILYPLGCSVCVQEIGTKNVNFLAGHSNQVICVAVSKCGRYIASGQVNHMGFPAPTFIWDFATLKVHGSHPYHKVSVEDVAFSATGKYLASLGGQDDNSLVLYDVEARTVVCGLEASPRMPGVCTRLIGFNTTDNVFLSMGFGKVRLWEYNPERRTLSFRDCCSGKLKRYVTSIQGDSVDRNIFVSTKSGDIVHLVMTRQLVENPEHPEPIIVGHLDRKLTAAEKRRNVSPQFSGGINVLVIINDGEEMILGTGDGWIKHVKMVSVVRSYQNTAQERAFGNTRTAKLYQFKLEELRSVRVEGSVTSLQLSNCKKKLFVGTQECNLFKFEFADFHSGELMLTSHASGIRQVVFANNFSQVFATAGKEFVRLWGIADQREIMRIKVANMICNALEFTPNGKLMITAWSDCTIRAFTPETGKCIYQCENAHMKGVTAICISKDDKYLVTGGGDGVVRTWSMSVEYQRMLTSLSEHKGRVSSIQLNFNDTKCVTASEDGTCIIWSVDWQKGFKRYQIVFANTLFQCAKFHPSGAQIITAGTDRFVAYFEVYNGELLRQLEGSPIGPIRTLDMTQDGTYFVSGGDDHFMRVWDYMTGRVVGFGYAHTSTINSVTFTPNYENIVSVSEDGAIVIWNFAIFRTEYENRSSSNDQPISLKTNEQVEQMRQQSEQAAEERAPSLFKRDEKPVKVEAPYDWEDLEEKLRKEGYTQDVDQL